MFLKTGRGQMFGGRRGLVERWRTSSGDEVHKLEGERIEQSERIAVETERECEPPQTKNFLQGFPPNNQYWRGEPPEYTTKNGRGCGEGMKT